MIQNKIFSKDIKTITENVTTPPLQLPALQLLCITRRSRKPAEKSRQDKSAFKFYCMKKYLFGLIAISIAIAGVAFTTPEKKLNKNTTLDYFRYISGAKNVRTNYTKVTPADACNGSNQLCGIWASDDGTANHNPTSASFSPLVSAYYNSGTGEFSGEQPGEIEYKN